MARKFYTKRIISPGMYLPRDEQGDPKPVNVTRERLKKSVDTFGKMRIAGMLIPAPFRHSPRAVPISVGTSVFTPGPDGKQLNLPADIKDDDAYNNGGYWDHVWQDKNDGALWGRVFSDREEAQERIATTVQECSPTLFTKWTDGKNRDWDEAMTHIALVTHPVEASQDNFKEEPMPEGSLSIAMSMLAFSENFSELVGGRANKPPTPGQAVPPADPPGPTTKNASNASVADVIKALATMNPGITLPEDTTAENFAERLLVAILAIQNREGANDDEGTTTTPPNGAKTETAGAITMSKFVEIPNPFDDKAAPVKIEFSNVEQFNTFATNPTVQNFSALAAENASLKTSLLDDAVKSVNGRIRALSAKGQLTKDYYEKHLRPLLTDSASFSLINGSYVHPTVDAILSALESAPPNPLLRNSSDLNLPASFSQGPPKGAVVLETDSLFKTEAGPGADNGSAEYTDADKKLYDELYAPHVSVTR